MSPEEIAQGHALHGASIRLELQLRQAGFKRTDAPAVRRVERLDGGAFLFVERTNVAQFHHRLAVFFVLIFEPAERVSLCAAHIWALGIDAARALFIQKGTGARRVRLALSEQRSMMRSNVAGFYLVNRQAVDAARAASPAALQTVGVDGVEAARLPVYVFVELFEGGAHIPPSDTPASSRTASVSSSSCPFSVPLDLIRISHDPCSWLSRQCPHNRESPS